MTLSRTTRLLVCAVLAVPAGATAGAPARVAAHARLVVEPLRVLPGDPVSIRARGLAPGALVTLSARTIVMDDSGRARRYQASANFMADARGTIDLAGAAPVSGDYQGADVRGLFWSQRPAPAAGAFRDSSAGTTPGPADPPRPDQVALTLQEGDSLLDRTLLTFASQAPGVVREAVRAPGLVGVFYHGARVRGQAVVVVLGGSEGGLDVADWIGPKLASRGFVVFGLAYFSPPGEAMDGVPTALVRIPLESLERARAWLGTRREADTRRLGLLGYSKGAEFALVLSASYDWIRAAVAYAPSDFVWQGIRYGPGAGAASSWSRGGRELPYLPTTGSREAIAAGRGSGERVELARIAKASLASAPPAALAAAAIPLERSHAALMLIGGGDDRLWDSGASVERLAARLERAGYAHAWRVLMYPAAGHTLLGTGWRPTTDDDSELLATGGTPAADARAQADSWPRVLAFLARQLGR